MKKDNSPEKSGDGKVELVVAIVVASLSLVVLVFALLMLLGSRELFGAFDFRAAENFFYSLGDGDVSMVFYTTVTALISVVLSFVSLILSNRSKSKGSAGARVMSLVAVILLFFALAIDVAAFAYATIGINK